VTEQAGSRYEPVGLEAVRPYLIVGDASAAIDFYTSVFGAEQVERHDTPQGGVGHAKLRFGETIVEIGEHPGAVGREADPLPPVGLRLYVTDIDAVHARALAAGATGDGPSSRLPGVRSATVLDPFGLTWWLAMPVPPGT